MTYIPTTRNQYRDELIAGKDKNGKAERNYYWQGYLNKADANHVTGFDEACECLTECLFHNTDLYEDILYLAGIDIEENPVDEDILFSDKFLEEYTPEEIDKLTSSTRILKAIREILLDYSEMERDEMIVSMIESMDNKEYEEIKEKADTGEYVNSVLQYNQ